MSTPRFALSAGLRAGKFALIPGFLLLAACTDSAPVAPIPDDPGSILAARGGGKGPPDKGDGGGSGIWDGTQEIVYVESFSKSKGDQGGERLVVVKSDGSKAATVFSLPREDGSLNFARASLSSDGNAIVLDVYGGIHIIRRDPNTGSISTPELLVPGGSQQAVSPDDSKIAYVLLGPFCEGVGALELHVFDKYDGTSTRITSNNQLAGCLTTDSISTVHPAWVSDTVIAVIQHEFYSGGTNHIAILDVGTIVDDDVDGVIDNVVETSSFSDSGGGPAGIVVDLEWAPDARRAVVTGFSPTRDLWTINFSVTPIQSCNITSGIDGSVGHASLGPQNKIVFQRGGGFQQASSIVTGTLGSGCTTVSLDEDPLAASTSGKNNKTSTSVMRPNWKRDLP